MSKIVWVDFQKLVLILLVATFSGCLIHQSGPSSIDSPALTPTLETQPIDPLATNTALPNPISTTTVEVTNVVLPLTLTPLLLSPTLTQQTAIATLRPPALIPSGWIALVNIAESIDIIQTNGKGLRSIVDSVQYPTYPAWSPDGQWIAFVGSPDGISDSQIYIVRPDGSELNRLTYTPGNKHLPFWAPNGQAIVYSQTLGFMGQAEVDLFLYELSPSRIRQITNTSGVNEYAPIYSPSGDRIAFISVGKDYRHSLMVMDADGSNPSLVIDTDINIGSLTWSPNGDQIVFAAGRKCPDLYGINSDGTELRHLTETAEYDSSPTWSPNGEWIAFTRASCNKSGYPGIAEVFIISADGSSLRKLTDTPSRDTDYPAWSPWPSLQVGQRFMITTLGANLNLRSSPSHSGSVLGKLVEEDIFVLEGPIEADDYLWWRVRVESSNLEGWVADSPGWFSPEQEE
jgi:TolB protein